MKDLTNDEYNLSNIHNYKKTIITPINVISTKYITLVLEYIAYMLSVDILVNKLNIKTFIIIRGLDTISHVFLNMLYHTFNIELTSSHSQRSFLFYLEFVSQISQDEKSFLQLSSRDASTYVYKKTIFELIKTKKNLTEESEDLHKIRFITGLVNILKLVLYKLLWELDEHKNNLKSLVNPLLGIAAGLEQYYTNLTELTEINSQIKDYCNREKKNNLKDLLNYIDKLINKKIK